MCRDAELLQQRSDIACSRPWLNRKVSTGTAGLRYTPTLWTSCSHSKRDIQHPGQYQCFRLVVTVALFCSLLTTILAIGSLATSFENRVRDTRCCGRYQYLQTFQEQTHLPCYQPSAHTLFVQLSRPQSLAVSISVAQLIPMVKATNSCACQSILLWFLVELEPISPRSI